jgi:hypothetical protein
MSGLPRPIDPPDEPWVDRLRRGHVVYLPKEGVHARIEFAYEPPEPGCRLGFIGVHRAGHPYCDLPWFISPEGCGLDGTQIMLPTEGNLPDEPAPISGVWTRHVETVLAGLMHRLEQMEAWLMEYTDFGRRRRC